MIKCVLESCLLRNYYTLWNVWNDVKRYEPKALIRLVSIAVKTVVMLSISKAYTVMCLQDAVSLSMLVICISIQWHFDCLCNAI